MDYSSENTSSPPMHVLGQEEPSNTVTTEPVPTPALSAVQAAGTAPTIPPALVPLPESASTQAANPAVGIAATQNPESRLMRSFLGLPGMR